MRRALLPLLFALTAGAHADVTLVSAVPTDRDGHAVTPRVGEPYFLTVNLKVAKQTAAYKLTIDAPGTSFALSGLTYGVGAPGDYWVRQGPIVPLYDGATDYTLACSAAKKTLKLHVVPTSPTTALEAYAPQRLAGTWSGSVAFDRAANLRAWLPLPSDSASQSVESVDAPIQQAITREAAETVGLIDAANATQIDASASATVVARGVRSNLVQLRAVPMSAIKDRSWLAPETRIESTNKEIVAFAKTATKGMGAKTPVADVALAVYSAILKRSVYATTGNLPDALSALHNGKGECGDLSALFVATCRAAGVPARTVQGFLVGTNAWHVWAEFNVPGKGWVPVDPAFALGRMAHAPAPFYFGVVPEMNARVALAHGFDATVGVQSTTFLQTPQIFLVDGAAKATSVRFTSDLHPTP